MASNVLACPPPLGATAPALPVKGEPREGAINGLRGYAILSVMFTHTLANVVAPWAAAQGQARLGLNYPFLVRDGWIGVNLFFLLSGFVLARPYLLGQRPLNSPASAKDFYLRRARRLLPLFLLGSTLLALISWLTGKNSLLVCLKSWALTVSTANLFLPHHWVPKINGVLWSLDVEIWFSLLFPLLFLGIAKWGLYRPAPVVFLVAALVRALGFYYSVELNWLKDSFVGRLDDFYLGFLLCQLYYSRTQPPTRWSGLAVAAGGLLVLAGMVWIDCVKTGLLPLWSGCFQNNLLQAGFLLLALGALWSRGWLAWCFNNRPIQVLGMMCYSLYMWHSWHGGYFSIRSLLRGPMLLVYPLVLFGWCAASYRWIENWPVKDWKRLFLLK